MTCPRCSGTEAELQSAVAVLKRALEPLVIEVTLIKDALSLEEFKKDPLRSNQILINGRVLEEYIGGKQEAAPAVMSVETMSAGLWSLQILHTRLFQQNS